MELRPKKCFKVETAKKIAIIFHKKWQVRGKISCLGAFTASATET